jgi:hypothetical protein
VPELWNYAAIGLAGGAAAFAHCAGMCGGLALHVAQGGLARQALWHAGKTTTYIFLGAMAGLFGQWFTATGLARAQDIMAYAAGAMMIVMGMALVGLVPARRAAGQGEGLLASLFGQLIGRPTAAGSLVLGLATGFLPCPIVMGMMALAAQGGSVLVGMVTLGAMGVGTVWALALLGLTGRVARLRLRRWAPALGAAVLVLAGTATMLRGTTAFHHLLGCPEAPAAVVPADSAPPCCHTVPAPAESSPQ